MATIGVLTYTLPTGLIINNSFDKVVVTNIPSITPNSNAIVTKIQDIGMISGDVLVMRKKQKLVPLLDSNVPNIQSHPPDKKIKTDHPSTKKTPKLIPQAQAVARRNARERNRVKQVNNGFAALRQRIPDEIAEAFESAGSGRGAAKKLSKVETLRMAVEYIRSLERILEIDGTDPESTSDSSNNPSKTVIKSEPYSSADDELYADYPDSNFDAEENMDFFHDNLPDVTTLHGQQYFRIPGTNTYQLIMHETFENEENVQPLSTNLTQEDLDSQLDYALKTATTTDDVRATPGPPAPISSSSPEPFSNNNIPAGLLSPADQLQHHHHHQQQQDLLSQLQMQHQHVRLKNEDTSVIYHQQQSHLAPNSPPISEGQVFNDVQLYEAANTILKRKPKEEDVILEAAVLSEESMMETIDWWDAHTPQSDDSVAL